MSATSPGDSSPAGCDRQEATGVHIGVPGRIPVEEGLGDQSRELLRVVGRGQRAGGFAAIVEHVRRPGWTRRRRVLRSNVRPCPAVDQKGVGAEGGKEEDHRDRDDDEPTAGEVVGPRKADHRRPRTYLVSTNL
jgi:hypothetical protein